MPQQRANYVNYRLFVHKKSELSISLYKEKAREAFSAYNKRREDYMIPLLRDNDMFKSRPVRNGYLSKTETKHLLLSVFKQLNN